MSIFLVLDSSGTQLTEKLFDCARITESPRISLQSSFGRGHFFAGRWENHRRAKKQERRERGITASS